MPDAEAWWVCGVSIALRRSRGWLQWFVAGCHGDRSAGGRGAASIHVRRKAVSQQTRMSRPRFCARWRRSAQQSPGDRSQMGIHVGARASVVDGLRQRTARRAVVRHHPSQHGHPQGTVPLKRHGGLLHGLARLALPRFRAAESRRHRRFTHWRPQGTVSADRAMEITSRLTSLCSGLAQQVARRSMCCQAAGGTTLRGDSDGGARAADGAAVPGRSASTHW